MLLSIETERREGVATAPTCKGFGVFESDEP
jgi:hypothetical protein